MKSFTLHKAHGAPIVLYIGFSNCVGNKKNFSASLIREYYENDEMVYAKWLWELPEFFQFTIKR